MVLPSKRIAYRWLTICAISLLMTVTIIPSLARVSPKPSQHNTILMIGDGMGWEITRAAAIQQGIDRGKSGKTLKDFYLQGKGSGLNMQTLQNYALSTTYGTTIAGKDGKYSSNQSALDDSQKLTGASAIRPNFKFNPKFNPGQGKNLPAPTTPVSGNLVGYDPIRGGANPWTPGTDREYIKASYPDSANTATTLYTGVKSYNNAIAVDIYEKPLTTILKTAATLGKSTGLVTSVPIDHATPGAASANVNRRSKYDLNAPDATPLDNILQQQLRIYQPTVLLGGGHPLSNVKDPLPSGIEPVHTYISEATYQELSKKPNNNIYQYTFLERGANAAQKLAKTAAQIDLLAGQRLLGLYGARGQAGNIPVSSANGDYGTTGLDLGTLHLTRGLNPDKQRPLTQNETDAQFIQRERNENPTLNDLTKAALTVLGKDPEGFWLMIEGGDIDWSAHDNHLDNLIGTTLDFDRSVGTVIKWIETHGGWARNQLIVTADHDHYFTLNDDFPDRLRRQGADRLTALNTAVDAGHYWGSQPIVAKDAAGKELLETGKYGWGNHTNRPVPVYYQGYTSDVLTKSIGKGFKLYENDIPGIPGLTDQVHIYQTQLAAVKTSVTAPTKN
jgi:alkaline phosphatase